MQTPNGTLVIEIPGLSRNFLASEEPKDIAAFIYKWRDDEPGRYWTELEALEKLQFLEENKARCIEWERNRAQRERQMDYVSFMDPNQPCDIKNINQALKKLAERNEKEAEARKIAEAEEDEEDGDDEDSSDDYFEQRERVVLGEISVNKRGNLRRNLDNKRKSSRTSGNANSSRNPLANNKRPRRNIQSYDTDDDIEDSIVVDTGDKTPPRKKRLVPRSGIKAQQPIAHQKERAPAMSSKSSFAVYKDPIEEDEEMEDDFDMGVRDDPPTLPTELSHPLEGQGRHQTASEHMSAGSRQGSTSGAFTNDNFGTSQPLLQPQPRRPLAPIDLLTKYGGAPPPKFNLATTSQALASAPRPLFNIYEDPENDDYSAAPAPALVSHGTTTSHTPQSSLPVLTNSSHTLRAPPPPPPPPAPTLIPIPPNTWDLPDDEFFAQWGTQIFARYDITQERYDKDPKKWLGRFRDDLKMVSIPPEAF